MISRLKAPVLSCLHPPAPPRHPSPPPSVEPMVVQQKESHCGRVREVEEFLPPWGKVEGSKDSFWENISSPSTQDTPPPPLASLCPWSLLWTEWWIGNLHCALRRPLLFLSHSPPPPADAQTQCVSGWWMRIGQQTPRNFTAIYSFVSMFTSLFMSVPHANVWTSSLKNTVSPSAVCHFSKV